MNETKPVRKTITPKLRFEVFKRDSFKCQYCGRSAPEVILHADHIKPVVEGGETDMLNLITSCSECNYGKGATLLDDQSMLEKQKAQLDELNEKREQLDMMIQWREELSNIQEDKFLYAKRKWEERTTGYAMNESGAVSMKSWLRKYDLNEILDAIQNSCDQYLEIDDGEIIHASVEKAYNYIPKICGMNKVCIEKPYLKDLFYIRGIIRNRLAPDYYNNHLCLELLETAYDAGATLEMLKEYALKATGWRSFKEGIEGFPEEGGDN